MQKNYMTELANDVYKMKFVENEDLSLVKIKTMLQNLDTIYNLTRNISIENSNIETGEQFNPAIKDMLFGFNTASIMSLSTI
jgi:hypothetical protein